MSDWRTELHCQAALLWRLRARAVISPWQRCQIPPAILNFQRVHSVAPVITHSFEECRCLQRANMHTLWWQNVHFIDMHMVTFLCRKNNACIIHCGSACEKKTGNIDSGCSMQRISTGEQTGDMTSSCKLLIWTVLDHPSLKNTEMQPIPKTLRIIFCQLWFQTDSR